VPAVNYDYSNARVNKSNQDVAKKARSVSASNHMSAQSKVASHVVNQNKAGNTSVNSNIGKSKNIKKYDHRQIDIPIVVKKKVELQKPEEMKLHKPQTKAKASTRTESAKKSIIATVLGFGMLLFICMRYAQINELTHQVGSLEKELASAESLNQQLTAEVDSKTDLNYIEKYAKYQLGMQKPDEKQIVRIPYEKQDKISTPIVIAEEREPSFLEKLWKDLKNIID